MKVVISQGGVKRELADEPWEIILSESAAQAIQKRLKEVFGDEVYQAGTSYASVVIYDDPRVKCRTDTPPEPWLSKPRIAE